MFEEVLCGKGTIILFSHMEQENMSTFMISNSKCMDDFVKEFKDKVSMRKKR